MVKTQKLVPEVYYNRSRDFQALGRVYDIIFNYLKTSNDTLSNLPYSEDIDDKLIPLVATTLGFQQTHEYNANQLKILCSCFASILRNKGNMSSISELVKVLESAENTTASCKYAVDTDKCLLTIYLPLGISDTALLEDMLYYVLPAGMSYRIIKQPLIQNEPLKDVMFISSDRSTLTLKANYNMTASQVTQFERNESIDKSTATGIGRIEDMHIIQYPQNGSLEKAVVADQENSPEDITLAPKDTTNVGE